MQNQFGRRDTSRVLIQAAVITTVGLLSMGNQSCEKAQTNRVLKMDIEISSLKARPVRMPTGETIDFPYVANSLFYRQVMDHDHFVIINPIPSINTYTANGFKIQKSQPGSKTARAEDGMVSEKDVNVLKKYGFLDKMLSGASSKTANAMETSSSLPACLYDLPQALLGGEVISFEATWGVGLGVGYGAGGDLKSNVGGKVQFDQSRLEIGLRTDDPLSQQVIAIGDGVSNQSKVNFGLDFGSGIPIGLNFFFNTPITDVIRSAMTKGLDKIVEKYTSMLSNNKDWNEVWESRVIDDPILVNGDTHIAFRAGYLAGVKEGDTFSITNMQYRWEGAACYTRLKYKIPLTTLPIATAKVVSVGDNVSVAKVDYLQEQRILPGAQVKLLALKQPDKAKAASASATSTSSTSARR